MIDLKRRHHYVWRRYLASWASDAGVWCRRYGKVFCADPMNLAQQRDFYKLQPLTQTDVWYIEKMLEKMQDPVVRRHNMRFLQHFAQASAVAYLPPPEGIDSSSILELQAAQAALRHNFDEDLHGALEQQEGPHLEALLKGEARGLSTRRIEFMHFMAGQHMRTKKIHDGVLRDLAPSMKQFGASIENCWPVLRHAFANSMAASLVVDRSFGLHLVRNETAVPFMTGDQPVVNTKAAPDTRGVAPTECELYYPISPTRAVLVSESAEWAGCSVSLEQVHWLNRLMVEHSYEMVFADNSEQLAAE